jgi:hypothetical protein
LPYEHFDGHYRVTDTKYISIGLAQWDPDEVSIKTMRYGPDKHNKDRWTRQAEELPLHRVIDMCIFLAKVIFDSDDGITRIPAETFERQNRDIQITRETRGYGELASYNAFLEDKRNLLKARLNALVNLLQELKDEGRI